MRACDAQDGSALFPCCHEKLHYTLHFLVLGGKSVGTGALRMLCVYIYIYIHGIPQEEYSTFPNTNQAIHPFQNKNFMVAYYITLGKCNLGTLNPKW